MKIRIGLTLLMAIIFFNVNAQVSTTTLAGDYKIINIGDNTYGDYTHSLILLHEIYNGTLIDHNYAIGTITAMRGNAGGGNRLNVVNVTTSSAYSGISGTITSNDDNVNWGLKTCMYNEKKYLAVDIPYSPAYHYWGYYFSGWTISTGENMKCVSYEVNGVPVNTTLISDIQDFTSNMTETHNAATVNITGNVGIGTTVPVFKLDVANNVRIGAQGGSDYTLINGGAGFGSQIRMFYADGGESIRLSGNNDSWLNVGHGNVGVGIIYPSAKLHVASSGSSSNATTEYSGDLIVQGNPGNRTSTSGASLEFVIPANTDGNNPWGQGRIITVAGNGNTFDATGKMILGTRRMFDKGTGTGTTWNYGDDIVITGDGSVGIGTTTTPTGYKFAVAGNAIAESMTVKLQANWPDYAFKKDYKLMPLSELKVYVDKNQHLPEIPSAAEVEKDGQNLGEMNKLLLKKVEELTLYLIDQQKQINGLKTEITELKSKNKSQN